MLRWRRRRRWERGSRERRRRARSSRKCRRGAPSRQHRLAHHNFISFPGIPIIIHEYRLHQMHRIPHHHHISVVLPTTTTTTTNTNVIILKNGLQYPQRIECRILLVLVSVVDGRIIALYAVGCRRRRRVMLHDLRPKVPTDAAFTCWVRGYGLLDHCASIRDVDVCRCCRGGHYYWHRCCWRWHATRVVVVAHNTATHTATHTCAGTNRRRRCHRNWQIRR
mmetsp:Transcript_20622/g.38997  ORF Transcript_20622/g.38997 Transcript_20622/m.38997 type:complete len:222 (+) Transcript_20622:3388-4053(+)